MAGRMTVRALPCALLAVVLAVLPAATAAADDFVIRHVDVVSMLEPGVQADRDV